MVSYPDHYSLAFAFSAIPCPLPVRTLYSVLTDRPIRAEVNGFTEFHDDDISGVGPVFPPAVLTSVCSEVLTEQPTACRLAQAHTAIFACTR